MCGGAVLVLAFLLAPIVDDPPLRTGTYVQNLRADGVTLSIVEPVPSELRATVWAETECPEDGVTVRSRKCRRHNFRVDRLEAGSRYRYEIVGVDGQRRGSGKFRTLARKDDQLVEFAVIGDSGKVPWWGWMQQSPAFYPLVANSWLPVPGPTRRIGELAASFEPDWFLHVGDVVYPRGENRFYTVAYFRPLAPLLVSSAGFLALGNHDHGKHTAEGPIAYLQNFELPINDATGDERMYTFVDGPVRAVTVDLSHHPETWKTVTEPWLRGVLDSATEPWIVFFQHYPLATSDPTRGGGNEEDFTRSVVLPLLQEYQVDIALAGHDHNYQRFGEPDAMPVSIVSGGGGKELYDMPDEAKGFAVRSKSHHLCRVRVEGPVLEFEAVDQFGKGIDKFRIDKGQQLKNGLLRLSGERSARTRALLN